MIDLRDTILSQYANSPILLALIEAFNAAVDPTALIDSFCVNVWDVSTAAGAGLDVWGRIVGVTRLLKVPAGRSFGFAEQSGTTDPFGQSPLWFGTPATANYVIPDALYRTLILIKARANISDSTIATYNTLLRVLFVGRGNTYVSDTGQMNIRLTCEFPLKSIEIALLRQCGAFVGPTGVKVEIMDLDLPYVVGFAESGARAAPFGQGRWFAGFDGVIGVPDHLVDLDLPYIFGFLESGPLASGFNNGAYFGGFQ